MVDTKRGAFWEDPDKRSATAQKMREAWAGKRYFLVTWDDGREVRLTSLEEVAKLVHRSTPTLRVYLAGGKGQVQLMHDGEQITLRRVYL